MKQPMTHVRPARETKEYKKDKNIFFTYKRIIEYLSLASWC